MKCGMAGCGWQVHSRETAMKRKVLIGLAAVIVIVLAVVAVRLLASEPEIRNWYDLYAIGRHLDRSYVLMNDLDSTTAGYEELAGPTANGGKGWEPIGTAVSFPSDGDEQIVGAYPFVGTFDGQGHAIRGLFINRPDENYVGLFRQVGEEGVVENIQVVNATVIGEGTVGGLVGSNSGTMNKCFFSGNLIGSQLVGGLVGATANWASVSNSYSNASVTGDAYVGGLVGANLAGTISSCHATGSVVGENRIGGLVGLNLGANVTGSHFSGNVTGDQYVGGLAGHTVGTVNNSHYDYDEILINGEKIITLGALSGVDFEQWLNNDRFLDVNDRLSQENGCYLINDIDDFKQLLVFGQDSSLKFRLNADLDLATEPDFYVPYLAGEFDGNGHKVSNLSSNLDRVSNVGLFGHLAFGAKLTQLGVENADITGFGYVGGLVGLNMGTVSASYSNGNVTGHEYVGGLVGYSSGTLSSSYAGASVTGDDHVGGLVGYSTGMVSNSYNSGTATGGSHVGGLVGSNDHTVSNSYSSGTVSGTEGVGGLVGQNEHGTVTGSFWDLETSGIEESDGGTAKNTTAMRHIGIFSGAGWNITAVAFGSTNSTFIWNIVNNVTCPFLAWQWQTG
jgi:hypothetical protein